MESANIQQEINKYKKFKKVDGATYRKVNQFLRKRTYITAREWALARLCTDFRTSGGAEMTFIGNHLPELVPFMEDTYTPQAVNQARNSFKKKVRKSSATFFYGAMCGFFTTDELDDLLFEASEVARFLLEVEGTTLDIDDEIDIEDRITKVMRSVGEAAKTILRTRSEANDAEPLSHTEGIDTLKKKPDPKEMDITKKTRRRKKANIIVTSKIPPIEQTPCEKEDAQYKIPEKSAILGIISTTHTTSHSTPSTNLDHVNVSPPSKINLILTDNNEKMQKFNQNKEKPEIEGDKNQ